MSLQNAKTFSMSEQFKDNFKGAFHLASLSYFLVWITGIIFSYLPAFWVFHGKLKIEPSLYAGQSFAERAMHIFMKFDSLVYPKIALSGYYEFYTVFFPGWIGVLKGLGLAFSLKSTEGIALAGTIINFGFFTLAIYVWERIGKIYGAKNTGLLLAFYPTTVFFVAAYPEILFVALGGLVMLSVLEDNKWSALLFLPLFIWIKHAGLVMGTSFVFWALFTRKKIFWWLLAGYLAGAVSVLMFYKINFGDPFLWLKAQQHWGRQIAMPWKLIAMLHGRPVDMVLYEAFLFGVPAYYSLLLIKNNIFSSLLKGFSRDLEIKFLAAIFLFSLYLPLWIGGTVISLYRIIILAPTALFIIGPWLRMDNIYGKRWIIAGIFLLINISSTYRYVTGLYFP